MVTTVLSTELTIYLIFRVMTRTGQYESFLSISKQ